MKYFNSDYVKFFKDLANNNNKEWFHSEKKRYENSVKIPFKNFVAALISEVNKIDPAVQLEPKDCISRINRDIRFSKDKTPYNLNLNAFVSIAGKKDKSIPGLFVRLSHDMVGIMGGCYALDKNQLTSLRSKLMEDPGPFKKLIGSKAFKTKFGELRGEKMKRIPKEYQEFAKKEPLILNKQFYYMGEEKSSLIASDKLMPTIIQYFKVMKPVNDYLYQSMD